MGCERERDLPLIPVRRFRRFTHDASVAGGARRGAGPRGVAVGEGFTTAGGRQLGRIVSVDPGKQLTGTIMGAFMSYVLVPREHDVTRLLLKVVMRTSRWAAVGLSVGDLIMARRQLLNLKQLAERHQRRVTAPG